MMLFWVEAGTPACGGSGNLRSRPEWRHLGGDPRLTGAGTSRAYILGAKINGGEFPLFSLPVFVILLILGILVIRAKPYYPKKYREWFERKKKSSKVD
jgi:hypothetical protein